MVIFSIYLIFFYFLHSLLAANTIKSFFSSIGLSPNYYRLFYNGVASFMVLVGIFIYENGEKTLVMASNNLTKVIAIIVLIAGASIVILALRNYNLGVFLGTQQVKNNPSANPDQLITEGMNKWVRHPLYLGTILFLVGVFLSVPNEMLLSLVVITIIYVFAGAYLEEQKLIAHFGEDYINYQKKVPMIFPKWW